jgi:hypothetical protein
VCEVDVNLSFKGPFFGVVVVGFVLFVLFGGLFDLVDFKQFVLC